MTSIKNTLLTRQRHMLLIYNIYRLVTIGLLFGLFWLNIYSQANAAIYSSSLLAYLVFGLVFLYIWYKQSIKFEQQVLWAGTVDIIVMVLFIHVLGYLESGLGILLNASIAVLSILAPGRLAIFFASIASCMLLAISAFEYFYIKTNDDLSIFFSTGIYGAGFFATALTAWYLAQWVRSSEHMALDKAKELASMHRLNEYIVERLQYGVIYIDTNQEVRVMNTAARQFFNISERQKGLTLQHVSQALYEKYLQFLSQRKEDELVAQAIIENPYLQVHFYSTSHAAQTAVLIILEDMTNIAQQAQQLKLASLGRFSASIAHELRNPLGAISHAVQLMGEGSHLNEEDKRLRQLIINNCNRMNTVIKNVLQISRQQQSKPETIELVPFVEQFIREFCIINQCDMRLNPPRDKKKTVVFDRSQLEQVLVILCDNAMQHGQDESGHVNINITIKTKARRTSLMVCDTGPGIPESIQNNIFDPFFSTLRSGYGMGLFIAKDLCEINQARLSLTDSDLGCCFTISFHQVNELRL
ncbi:two-component system sensor kinase PilS [Legionella londiniensis]|uniref:histidine kinase n=2 Tax=Legionella londiniensis TaxID=45068 RepID=A0A0W0VQR2_9GAMM|nr:ATP-binding protein [Legionella londiniensis]KTD22498.1 sensor protein PilS [Legionella londiniensis]STX93349.1 two-component system sensor kinase PilS [Legionella londiniensis]